MPQVVLQQQGRTLPADTQTPISLYQQMVGKKPGLLLESAEVDGRWGRYSLVAWDFRLVASCHEGNLELTVKDARLEALRSYTGLPFEQGLRALLADLAVQPPEELADLPIFSRGVYGYLGYGLAGCFEPALADQLPPEKAEACLVLPAHVLLFDHLHHRCVQLSLDDTFPKHGGGRQVGASLDAKPRLGQVETRPDKEQFCQSVRRIREDIHNGEAIQVVLSTRFQASFSGEAFAVYRRLRQYNPSPYMYFLRLPGTTIVGSSPEVLVRCSEGRVEECPIAGTRHRGTTREEDAALADELAADPKERAEHVMLVDLGRNDLGRIAAAGSVRVDRLMQVERFSHVMHLTSYLEAELKTGLDAVDVLAATFPAGTVSGAPKIRAMETIAEHESQPRGPYAGAVGWIGLDTDQVALDTGICIRTLWIQSGTIFWQAGAGIVADSDPEKEWQECQNKARILREVLQEEGESDVFAHR